MYTQALRPSGLVHLTCILMARVGRMFVNHRYVDRVLASTHL